MNYTDLQKKYEKEYLDKLSKFISIPSVLDESAWGSKQPFGKPIQEALEFIVDYAKELGLKTYIDPKGHYGWAEIGSGETLYGVLGHIDVVPVNEKEWDTNPFELVLKDGMMFGRGVDDDKGPLIATMIAIKSLVEDGHKFNNRVRMIFGTDEESGWRCVPEYIKTQEIPSMSFTPDASFPVVFAEKGLVNYRIKLNEKAPFNLKAGKALNIVIDEAIVETSKANEVVQELKRNKIEVEQNGNVVKAIGKAAHAKEPQTGVNAALHLIDALSKNGNSSDLISFIQNEIANDAFAKNIVGSFEDKYTGPLTLNVGKVDFNDKYQEIEIDIRFPGGAGKTIEELDAMLIKSSAKYNLSCERTDLLNPVFFEREHPLIELLYSTYVEVTGDTKTQPSITGGTTYAKAIPNCVAFGPKFPWVENTEHQSNEHFPLKEAFMGIEIYRKVLEKLTK